MGVINGIENCQALNLSKHHYKSTGSTNWFSFMHALNMLVQGIQQADMETQKCLLRVCILATEAVSHQINMQCWGVIPGEAVERPLLPHWGDGIWTKT